MTKPIPNLRQQWDEIRKHSEREWKDNYAAIVVWARSQGYNGHQKVVRLDPDHPYGPHNCTLLEVGKQKGIIVPPGVPAPTPAQKPSEETDVTMHEGEVHTVPTEEEAIAAAKADPGGQIVTLAGRTQTAKEWCSEIGLKHAAVYATIRKDGNAAKAIAKAWQKQKAKENADIGKEPE